MADGGKVEARGWKAIAFLKERQHYSHLCCPCVLLRLGHPYSNAHLNCCQQHNSQERSTRSRTHGCDHWHAL